MPLCNPKGSRLPSRKTTPPSPHHDSSYTRLTCGQREKTGCKTFSFSLTHLYFSIISSQPLSLSSHLYLYGLLLGSKSISYLSLGLSSSPSPHLFSLIASLLLLSFPSFYFFSLFSSSVEMVKKGKKVAVEEDARARFRYQSLRQDFEELFKETEAKKKMLQKTKQKKLKLLAEVRFLRKKYKSFIANPSQETTYRLKKQALPSSSVCIAEPPISTVQGEVPLKDRSSGLKESAKPRKTPILDLNQSSFPNGEEMQEFQVEWEPLKAEKLKRCSIEGGPVVSDLNIPVCRDSGSGSGLVGKRKITWQDQVALRV